MKFKGVADAVNMGQNGIEGSHWQSRMRSRMPFYQAFVAADPNSGSATLPTTAGSYHVHRVLDKLDNIQEQYIEFQLPQLQAAGTADVAHYVNSVGFALIDKISYQMGNSGNHFGGQYDGYTLQYLYETLKADEEWDHLSGTFYGANAEQELIRRANQSTRQVVVVPICLPNSTDKYRGIQCLSLYGSPAELRINYNAVSAFTVNRGDWTAFNPISAETGSALALSEITATVFYHGVVLPHLERYFTVRRTHHITLDVVKRHEFSLTAAAGAERAHSESVDLNLPTYNLTLTFDADEDYTYQAGKVGTKDRFYRGGNTTKELIQNPDHTINSNGWVGQGPSCLLRVHQAQMMGFKVPRNGPHYFLTQARDLVRPSWSNVVEAPNTIGNASLFENQRIIFDHVVGSDHGSGPLTNPLCHFFQHYITSVFYVKGSLVQPMLA